MSREGGVGACPGKSAAPRKGVHRGVRDEHADRVGHADFAEGDEFHPIANVWPLLGEREQRALAADIEANGVRNPIVRHRDGRIVVTVV
jgi:hypothetical protein